MDGHGGENQTCVTVGKVADRIPRAADQVVGPNDGTQQHECVEEKTHRL